MAIKRDYYEVLGLGRDATEDDIKSAFRKLAFKYHPDHNRGDGAEDQFKELNEAYQVLSDPERRAQYDRFGHAGAEGPFGQGFEGFGGFGGLGDIFDVFFGGTATATRNAPQRGADLHLAAAVTFEEVASGTEKELDLTRTEVCPTCQGTGARPGTQPQRCPACNGTGEIRQTRQTIFGRFVNTTVCLRCRGEGRVITEPCPECRGAGRKKQQRAIRVKVPAGIDHGNQVRIAGEGDAGTRGGPSGDLYVTVSLFKHDLFTRDGDDIRYKLKANFAEAALGADIEVPTIDGKANLKVPPGSQTGSVFRLKGKGFPRLRRGGRGDELVMLVVVTPGSLSKRQRELLHELGESLDK